MGGFGVLDASSLYEGNCISSSLMEQSSSSERLLDGVDV